MGGDCYFGHGPEVLGAGGDRSYTDIYIYAARRSNSEVAGVKARAV